MVSRSHVQAEKDIVNRHRQLPAHQSHREYVILFCILGGSDEQLGWQS